MVILKAILSVVLLWVASNLISFIKNYLVARKCNLPIVITPINMDNIFWRVLSQPMMDRMEATLPAFIFRHIRPCVYGWEMKGTYRYHQRMGKSFLLVGPGETELWSADPLVAHSVLQRWKNDFPTMPLTRQVMDFMGVNLLTSDGDVWARQRRLIAPNLNERISGVTWTETSKQSRLMAEHLQQQTDGVTKDTVAGLKAIALSVLSIVGYGQEQTWSISELENIANIDDPTRTGKAAVFSAINLVIHNLVICAVLSSKTLQLPFMPKFMQKLGKAKELYPVYSKQMLDAERELSSSEPRQNMASMLAQLSGRQSEVGHGAVKATSKYLTPEEINGNLFVFTAAGYETTANAMGYAIVFLAAQPKWQDWIQEELDEVFAGVPVKESGDYTALFPRLQRCLALMLETLRVVPPLCHITRSTERQQVIETSHGTATIPGKVKVYLNNVALQSDPAVWGDDSTEFRPSRWTENDKDARGNFADATRKGYLPWSGGPRTCPGAKMAQVEFIATMATLFRQLRVAPVLKSGETVIDGRERLLKAVDDSMPVLTMQFRDATDIKLRWTTR